MLLSVFLCFLVDGIAFAVIYADIENRFKQ